MTSKVVSQSLPALVNAVNRKFDSALGKGHMIERKSFLDKCKKRLADLRQKVRTVNVPNPEVGKVKRFYQDLAKNPDMKNRMIQISHEKSRRGLLPDETDLRILAEALEATKEYDEPCFIHKDRDFGEFAKEIEEAFGIKVCGVDELISLRERLTFSQRRMKKSRFCSSTQWWFWFFVL
nr:hypothetical protein [Candidatus Njordarchaeota archaeon]